jgi:hypothetical protein
MVSLFAQPLDLKVSTGAARPGSIDVRIAETPEDRDAIFRLRFELLDGRPPANSPMIATNGRMVDPEDAGSILLGAFDRNGRAIASIRLRALDDEITSRRLPAVIAGFGRRMSASGERSSTSSDLMLSPSADRHVQVRLVAAMFEAARVRAWRFDVCLVRPEEIAVRRRLGYLEFGVQVADDDVANDDLTLMSLTYPAPPETPSRRWFRRS